MDMKQENPRTLQLAQIEFSQTCQQIGFLSFQIEREIPREIEKLYNKVMDLQKEIDKFNRIEADKQQENVDKLKAQLNGNKPALEAVSPAHHAEHAEEIIEEGTIQ